MYFIYVDDEESAIINFQHYIKDNSVVESIEYFSNPQDAIAYAQHTPFDVAFLDIEMPEMTGINLAQKLKAHQPDIEIVYITAHCGYHQEAYQSEGRAYLLKPFGQADIDSVFSFLAKLIPTRARTTYNAAAKPPIFVQTFGNFDLWVNGEPVRFQVAKAKELLALLINEHGSTVHNIEIFNQLWPEKDYTESTATYVRRTVQALKAQLTELGCADMVTFARNAYHINESTFVCDFYTVAAGDNRYLASYKGYYMAQYPWAEESIYVIEQSIKQLTASMQ